MQNIVKYYFKINTISEIIIKIEYSVVSHLILHVARGQFMSTFLVFKNIY